MWINLEPQEEIINLELDFFNNYNNNNWEYIFWHEKSRLENDELRNQTDFFSDSIGNLQDSSKRIKGKINISMSKQVSKNLIKKDTNKSEFSNFINKENIQKKDSNVMSRNLTINRGKLKKNSSKNIFSSQSFCDSDNQIENEEKKNNFSQSSLESQNKNSSNSRRKTFVNKNKNIAKALQDNQKKDMKKINKSVNEFVFLMENPQSWVNKLEIDYKDYNRGKTEESLKKRQFDGEV